MPQAPARGNGGIVNPNAPIIFSPSMGLGAPTFTTRSPGTRLVLRDALGASSADYALGVVGGSPSSLWIGVPTTFERIKKYFGTTACYTYGPQNMSMFFSADRTMTLAEVGSIGDIPSGCYAGSNGSGGITMIPSSDNGTAGVKAAIVAFNGSAWRSMFEAANVASGEPNAILVKSGGKVGVGTSSPAANLNVYGASGTLIRVLVDNDATYGVAFGVDASNVGFYGSTNATPIAIKTSNTDRLTCGATDGLLTFKFGVAESGVTRRTSGSSYTMLTSDRVISFASGSSGALNLIASPETGRVVDVRNDSGGDITLTPAAGNINGAGTLALPTGTGWALRYDGTQWITFG